MSYDFDTPRDRRSSDSEKWRRYPEDVLPLWVADMDFVCPEPVIRALRERVAHGIFGYGTEPAALRQVLAERMARLYNWQVSETDFVFLPGVVTGFNLACRAVASPGDAVLIQTPIYPPILEAPDNAGLRGIFVPLIADAHGRYTIDFDLFERSIDKDTRLFILCNPHNPVGRVFERAELERMAEICLRHNIVICSDEIHCDLVFSGQYHIPIATLDPAVAMRTITLMAPSKTFNIAGLQCSFAIIQDAALRRRFRSARAGLVPYVNIMGFVAALAAYQEGQPWLDEMLAYLEANRDFLVDYVHHHLPGVRVYRPEATMLAWLDCRATPILENPYRFFLEHARVALSDGKVFGPGGEGFVRLNFGCPRKILAEALDRMHQALLKDERDTA
ncbi:MAG: PatB family C-S lyase [Anaerolineae bacterium]|nr:PatB family C-S lyase [Anaerolineae bacterium]MDW8070038.1 PatB family C-S lyase [Anaerolineae bacterium]